MITNKYRATISINEEIWRRIQTQADRMEMSASALVSFVMNDFCNKQDALFDRLLNLSPQELAEYKVALLNEANKEK